MNNTVYLAPYDPDWPRQFALHAKQIRAMGCEEIGRMLTFRNWL